MITSLVVLVLAGTGIIGWIVLGPRMAARQRAALRAESPDARWSEVLPDILPLWRRVPDGVRSKALRHMRVFLDDVDFVAGADAHIDEHTELTIAAQACLMIAGYDDGHYPGLRTIILYPGAFRRRDLRPDEVGVVSESELTLAGESWQQGHIVLSWDDVQRGTRWEDDGYNVVFHEFAHQLDAIDGETEGAPPIASPELAARWKDVFAREFDALRRAVSSGERTLIDDYGASSPAEFFAVVTEVFFENGSALKQRHSALYSAMADFYQLNPADWQ